MAAFQPVLDSTICSFFPTNRPHDYFWGLDGAWVITRARGYHRFSLGLPSVVDNPGSTGTLAAAPLYPNFGTDVFYTRVCHGLPYLVVEDFAVLSTFNHRFVSMNLPRWRHTASFCTGGVEIAF